MSSGGTPRVTPGTPSGNTALRSPGSFFLLPNQSPANHSPGSIVKSLILAHPPRVSAKEDATTTVRAIRFIVAPPNLFSPDPPKPSAFRPDYGLPVASRGQSQPSRTSAGQSEYLPHATPPEPGIHAPCAGKDADPQKAVRGARAPRCTILNP